MPTDQPSLPLLDYSTFARLCQELEPDHAVLSAEIYALLMDLAKSQTAVDAPSVQ